MTFPGGGVVVVENFSAWIAAKGATISDCVCGGVNPADFIVALGLNPEDVLAYTSLSMFYERAGRIAEAEEAGAKARMLDWKRRLGEESEA